MRCKPIKQFIFTYSATSLTPCNINFNARQIWEYSDIGNDLVEVWRDNVSVRMERDRFERCFRRVKDVKESM